MKSSIRNVSKNEKAQVLTEIYNSPGKASEDRAAAVPTRSSFIAPHLNRLSNTVDNIVGGLVGVFSDKLQSFVADAVPAFREQYDSFKREPSSGHVTTSTFGR
jgi:hypothetical protein